VAVGRRIDTPDRVAAAWTSVDGTKWAMADGGAAFAGGQLTAVSRAAGGVIAVGNVAADDRAAVWLSPDGTAWERVSDDAEALEHAFLWTVLRVPDGSGYLGGGMRTGEAFAAAVWSSVDGRTWIPTADLPDARGAQVRSLAVGSGLFVAAGDRVGHGQSRVWTSTDGLAWTAVADEDLDAGEIVRVVAGGPGFVAVGSEADGDAAVWTSVDGTDWRLAPPDPAFDDSVMSSVAAGGDRLVSVGALRQPIPGSDSVFTTPVSWISRPPA
jgi:hypothetical protein